MSSVIIELQQEALARNVSISDLLRKSLVVARKLRLNDFQEWIGSELGGYGGSEIPEYREVTGEIRGWNPYNGWIPLYFENPKEAEHLSKRKASQSVAELEHLLESGDSTLHMPFSHDIQKRLSDGFGYQTQVTLFTGRVAIVGILDTVRTIILNWALKLEEDGVMGEELSFSDQEKTAAASTPQGINYFYGPVQNALIQQNSPESSQAIHPIDLSEVRAFVEELVENLGDLKLEEHNDAELQSEVRTLQAQVASPKPNTSIITESLTTIRRVLEGAAGGAASQLMVTIARLLNG